MKTRMLIGAVVLVMLLGLTACGQAQAGGQGQTMDIAGESECGETFPPEEKIENLAVDIAGEAEYGETFPPEEEIENLVVVESTVDGGKNTFYYLGSEGGPMIRLHSEGADGYSVDIYYYVSGNIQKDIGTLSNGEWHETHYMDDGYIKDGVSHPGTVCYSKLLQASGEESELFCDENGVKQFGWVRSVDGSYSEYYWANGKFTRTVHENADGSSSESIYDENGKETVTIDTNKNGERTELHWYPNGGIQKTVCTNAAGTDRSEQEYYENGAIKRELIQNEEWTSEQCFDEEGYCTYYRYMTGEMTEECISDETGKLVKYIFNGEIKEDPETLAEIAARYHFRQ